MDLTENTRQNTMTKLRENYNTYYDRKENLYMDKTKLWNRIAIAAAIGSALVGAIASDKKQEESIEKAVNKYMDYHSESRKEEKES